MSYILDALRKADAERARGAVPDLHAQPVLRSSAGAAPSVGAQPWVWIAGVVAVTAVSGLAWMLLARDAPREPAAAAVANVAAPVPLPIPSPISSQTAPIVAAPAPPLAQTPARPPAQASALARPAPEPVRPVARRPGSEAAGMASAAPTRLPASAAGTAPTPTPAPAPAPAPAAAEPRLYTYAELPEEIRRALPALAIGGAMYSQNAASRMLIINGQVFHERDTLAPELTLVQIRLKSAVLDYRGYRYSVSY